MGPASEAIKRQQEHLYWAQHLVIIYPLWMGDMPALLKAYIEQVFRPGFAFEYGEGKMPRKLLKGRTARIVVTMGMPGFVYKLFFRAHSVKILQRNMLAFVGIKPLGATIVGSVEEDAEVRAEWLKEMAELGASAH
jgi:putative NADPH-quinone reductase